MNPNLILSYLGSFIWPSWRYLHGYRFHVFFEGFQDPPKSEDRQKWKVLWGLQGPITKYKRLPEAVDLTGKQTFADNCRPSGRKLITSDNRTRSQYPQPYAPDKQGPADLLYNFV